MGEQLLLAGEATKTHTEALDTFQSRDFGPVGLVDTDRISIVRRRAPRECAPVDRLEERVAIIQLAAGVDGRFIDFAVKEGARGLEGFGRGNVPVGSAPAILRALATGIPVVITSRCPRGRILDTYAYEGGCKHLRSHGAILGGLLPSHKARIKLMVLLGAGLDCEQIRQAFEA
jgi:L-asparaginase